MLFLNIAGIITRGFCTNTYTAQGVMRYSIIFDKKMPSLYVDKNLYVDPILQHKIYSVEHIFPRCLLNKKDHYDMHNTIRTLNELNVNRSNYKFTEHIHDDKNWIKLNFDNYVNHKLKLFAPNKSSRGFIARAVLYMSKEYDYNPHKIIDKDVLLHWFFNYPPDQAEKHHNEVVKKLQHKNNIFISAYNKKTKSLLKYLQDL